MKHHHLIASTAAALFALQCQAALQVVAGQPELIGKTHVADSDLRILSDSRFQAIFCGDEGTETSDMYSSALSSDLKRLESAGLSTFAALAHLKQRACLKK